MDQREEMAYRKGVEETALALFELVDDCDRALEALHELETPDAMRRGLETIRLRLLKHFESLGFYPVDPLGDLFDPHSHQAVATEAGLGQDGIVTRVHRRGWLHGEKLVQAAMVTVRQGEPDEVLPWEDDEEAGLERRRRRPRRREA